MIQPLPDETAAEQSPAGIPPEGKRGQRPYRGVAIAAVFLAITVLSSGDLIEIIPVFAPFVGGPLFPFVHETHDILAAMLALYAAHKLTPALGTRAMVYSLVLHLPYAYHVFPAQLLELVRIAITAAAAFLGIYIIWLRKRAEERLRLQATALDSAANAIFITDRQGVIEWVNPAFTRITGHSAEEAIGQTPRILKSGKHTRAFYKTLWDTILAGEVWHAEMVNRRPDGGLFTVQQTITPLRNAQGEISHFVAIQQDITERVLAEEALRVSEERYRVVAEAASDVIIVIDEDSRIQFVNPASRNLFGYTAAELLGESLTLLMPESLQGRHLAAFQRYLESGQRSRDWRAVEIAGRRKDGSEFPIEISFGESASDGKRFFGGVVRDITERRQALESLKLFRTLIDRSNDAIEVVDPETLRFLDVNEKACLDLGYSREELLSLRVLDIDPTLDPSSVQRMLEQLQKSGFVIYEGRHRRKDGTTFPVEVNIKYIGLDRDYVVSIVRDTTERKQAEQEIRRRAEEFAALYETSRRLAEQSDLPTLLQTIVERATTLLQTPGGGIELHDSARGDLELVVVKGIETHVGTRLRLGEGMTGRVAQTHQPMRVDDYRAWPDRAPAYDGVPISSIVQVPMLFGGELIGVLGVNEIGATERKFTEADARLLSLFASQAASAVRNARLLAETRHRLRELEAVSQISNALRTALALEDMLPRLLDETLAALGTDSGVIWLYEAENGELRQAVARGWFASIHEPSIKPGEGIAGAVFASGQAHVANEFATDPRTRESAREQVPPGWGGACVPIRTADETVGVFFVSAPLPRALAASDIDLLSTLAEIAGNAIHRMRLHEQTERQLRRLAALHAIDKAISSSLDLRATLNVLLEQVTTQLRVDAADVLLLNPHLQTLEYSAGRGFRSGGITRSHLRLGECQAGRSALERRTIHIPDLASETNFVRAGLLAGEGFVTHYVGPLIAKGEVKGVLEVFHRAPLHANEDWLNFLEALAGQAAIAIDNAELFDGLQRSNTELALAYDATIEGWSRALDLRDKETEGHSQRVTEMTERLARAMSVSDEELVHLRRGALLHDMGKMGVPDNILLKPGKLTDEEWIRMKQHPQFAYDMLAPIPFLKKALDIPYCHHEKLDGTGYPRGLKGEQIPLAARLFAIVDVWDALRSDRPYRQGWSEEKVREHIRASSGTHFDPQVVEAFMRMLEEK